MNEVNIILNDNIVRGFQGETILDVARRHGVEIPTLCHDPRIEPFTSCYICVVEVEGLRGLQPSCSTKIAEGMKIDTRSAKVKKARKTALDLLLSNHYADCMAPCKETCPAGVDVQGYISFIEKGMYHEAVELIKETNPLPAICGRVCVRPCEVACRRNLLDEGTGVGIDYLKRFASDKDLASPRKWRPVVGSATGKRVCIIGAGPAGLSAAFFLRKQGHDVDIYEAAPAPGGWLRYGIPEYRLPNDLLQQEVDNITELGVNIFYNQRLGGNLKFAELKSRYDAFVLAIGSQAGTSLGCEGDDAVHVFSGVDFLKEMEMTGKRFDFGGKRVAVVGGGNTAMDCCRSSVRCGAAKTYIVYRRTEKEMPANPIEIHESRLEGVEYMLLTNPTKVNKDAEGKVKSMTCIRMELGEPDASGRRRPVPVEGSEFELELDYILAAIGQKTTVDFLQDINLVAADGELKANKWGDIEADPKTLQTGIPGIFAAGDGVSGPATLIQAIAQARIAARSCHQYLSDLPLETPPFEFLSRKEHFKPQLSQDYRNRFPHQMREEMPTLPPEQRNNFLEVELGYASEEIARNETKRCLECGCTEYYTCDLKRYATEYQAEQKRLCGEFKEYAIDFRHPFIEIDNNKCILCSRCVRICREVVGANALGLVNRGFETFVAPSLGLSLQETDCESCGLCISACPTAAMSENFSFKPGPVKLEVAETVCNFCSVGCRINLHHKNGFVMKVTGAEGPVETNGNLCRYAKFGYGFYHDPERITSPMRKVNGEFVPVTFEEAYDLLAEKIRSCAPGGQAFFGGARLTNEELYLVQKLARLGAGTNQVGSFLNLGMDAGLDPDVSDQVPFGQIGGAGRIYLLGAELARDHGVVGFMVQETRYRNHVPVNLITGPGGSEMRHKADREIRVRSYYHFVKAVNHYLLSNMLQNQLFIDDRTGGFAEYRRQLLEEKPEELALQAGLAPEVIAGFAEEYNKEMNAVLICSAGETDAATRRELVNLALITGKLGKNSSGLIFLKEKNNSQGLVDMGVGPETGVGGICLDDHDYRTRVMEKWGAGSLPEKTEGSLSAALEEGRIRNLFIFGEDPVACAVDTEAVKGWFGKAAFVMVQDYFLTATAKLADLVLPASFPAESGGSFTNTQKVFQEFDAVLPLRTGKSGAVQLLDLLGRLRSNGLERKEDVMMEAFSLLPVTQKQHYAFHATSSPAAGSPFRYGCDTLRQRFDLAFREALAQK